MTLSFPPKSCTEVFISYYWGLMLSSGFSGGVVCLSNSHAASTWHCVSQDYSRAWAEGGGGGWGCTLPYFPAISASVSSTSLATMSAVLSPFLFCIAPAIPNKLCPVRCIGLCDIIMGDTYCMHVGWKHCAPHHHGACKSVTVCKTY